MTRSKSSQRTSDPNSSPMKPWQLTTYLLILSILLIGVWPDFAKATDHLSFSEALSKLIESNPDIRAQKARVKLKEAQLIGAKASFLPNLSIESSESRLDQAQPTQGVAVTSDLILFRSGADWAVVKASSQLAQTEQLKLDETILSAEDEAIRLLISLISTQSRLALSEDILELSQELADIEERRYQQGLIPKQESEKAKIQLSNVLARHQDVQSSLLDLQAILDSQLSINMPLSEQSPKNPALSASQRQPEIGAAINPADSAKANKTIYSLTPQFQVSSTWPWLNFLEKQSNKLLELDFDPQQNPTFLAAQKLVEAKEALAQAQLRQNFPNLSLGFSYEKSDLSQSQSPALKAAINLEIPIFILGNLASYQAQKQEVFIAKAQRDAVQQRISGNWHSVRQRLALALSSARARSQSVGLARTLYQDNQKRLRLGRSNLNDAVVDQNRLSDAESLAIDGWAQAHLLYAEFCHLRGKRAGCKN